MADVAVTPIMAELLADPDGWRKAARAWAEELELENEFTDAEVNILWLRIVISLSQRETARVLDRAQQLISRFERRAMEKAKSRLEPRKPRTTASTVR